MELKGVDEGDKHVYLEELIKTQEENSISAVSPKFDVFKLR